MLLVFFENMPLLALICDYDYYTVSLNLNLCLGQVSHESLESIYGSSSVYVVIIGMGYDI